MSIGVCLLMCVCWCVTAGVCLLVCVCWSMSGIRGSGQSRAGNKAKWSTFKAQISPLSSPSQNTFHLGKTYAARRKTYKVQVADLKFPKLFHYNNSLKKEMTPCKKAEKESSR